MAMNIKQFRYASDNLGYLLYAQKEAMAIDGGAVDDILGFLEQNGLELKWVTHTHGHPDHTAGSRELIRRSGSTRLDHLKAADAGHISLEGDPVKVIHTPGHTNDSVCFAAMNVLVCGDTLFNGTVGNCFSGDLEGFYRSIKTLLQFPPETIVYAGHDYVAESIAFAREVEPGNSQLDPYLSRYRPDHVYSTLADEIRVNPFLRFNEPSIIDVLKRHGWKTDTELNRWESVMRLD